MKSTVLTVFTAINLALVCFCSIGCVYVMCNTTSLSAMVDAIVECIAALAAIEYFVRGAKKDAAKYYKMFMLFEASTFVIVYAFCLFEPKQEFMIMEDIFSLLLFGSTLLLALGKDLGQKVSLSLASFNVAVYLYALISAFVKSLDNPLYIIMTATWFSISGLALIMTIAKYIDKKSRNTK